MAKDLAVCGISSREAFEGDYKYPSVWILDSAIAVLACECGLPADSADGGYCPVECADLWDWPPGWTAVDRCCEGLQFEPDDLGAAVFAGCRGCLGSQVCPSWALQVASGFEGHSGHSIEYVGMHTWCHTSD
eukprot:6117030-Amphidinium_carterae.1